MSEDIVQDTNINSSYDKEVYKKKKQEQLQNVYRMIDNACEELKNGNQKFLMEYLDVQSCFDKYTIRNALLVARQLPSARQLKDYHAWKETGVTFKNNFPKKIAILEPRDPYLNASGKKVIPYGVKELIDVSETNTKPSIKNYDKKLLLQSILYESPIKIKLTTLSTGDISKWMEDDNVIYVKGNNTNYDLVINSILVELSKALLYKVTGEMTEEKAKCIGYMLCKKYNIDYLSNEIFNPFIGKEINDIKIELTTIKSVFEDIDNHMMLYLDKQHKEKNKKDRKAGKNERYD